MIYLDNAATHVPYIPGAIKYLNNCSNYFGNASSIYKIGEESASKLYNARLTIASIIGASPDEVIFTSGGSESNNWALSGTLNPGDHLITSAFEHDSILNTARALEKIGVDVTYVRPNSNGFVSLGDFIKAARPNTKMISIMYVNNELGTIQPVKEIAQWAKSCGYIVHTDAVQAVGHIDVNVEDLCVDMLSASAHKFGGPKGKGFLYLSESISKNVRPLIYGGGQENHYRAGTEDVPGIIWMSDALRHMDNLKMLRRKFNNTCNEFVAKLLSIQGVTLNTPVENKAPWIINLHIDGVNAEALIMALSELEIYISAGSACNAASKTPSHVLTAIGLSDEYADSCVRISVGDNSKNELDDFVTKFSATIKMLRE